MYLLLQTIDGRRSGDTIVLDSVAGHAETLARLRAFVGGHAPSIDFAAPGRCPLCPDWPTLTTFRMMRTKAEILTEELPGEVLQVSGRDDLLLPYISAFEFPRGEGHHHPEQMDGIEVSQRGHGRWCAELGEAGYRYVPKRDRGLPRTFPCVFCRVSLDDRVDRRLAIGDPCPSCGRPIHAPLHPPGDLGWSPLRA